MSKKCHVHNVRFYELPPRSAHCLAYSPTRNLLALSRADYSIEIWHIGQASEKQKYNKSIAAPVLQRIIPAQETQGSVEALVWAGGKKHSQTNQINGDIKEEDDDSDSSSISTSNSTRNSKKTPKLLEKLNEQLGSDDKDSRLFSTGLHGLLIEHDLDNIDKAINSDNRYVHDKQSVWSVTSGAAWCMSFNRRVNKLAIGTEEGYVSLFRVGAANALDFDKVLDKQEGRILCLDWHSDGRHIVTGSPDTIRVWDAVTGHPLTRMSTGRTEKHRETTVWSLIMLDDFTVVSGDSRGKTSFWNGRTGTLTDAYQTHIADVLTVATNESQSIVYSSGVDPHIMQFQPISTSIHSINSKYSSGKNTKIFDPRNGEITRNMQKRPKWVKTSHRMANTHDVRAILCVGKKVLSVGVDADLCINDTMSRTLTKHPPIPHGCNVVVATASSTLERAKVALRYDNRIEVWSLGDPIDLSTNVPNRQTGSSWANSYLPLKKDAEKLLTLNSKDNMPIVTYDMTRDASALAYVTTDSCVRIFSMEFEVDNERNVILPKISKIPFRNQNGYFSNGREESEEHLSLSRFNIVKFLPSQNHDSSVKLLLSTIGGTLQCYTISLEKHNERLDTKMIWSLSPAENLYIQSGISHLEVHPGGIACAVADFDGNVRLIDLRKTDDEQSDNISNNTEFVKAVHKIPSYPVAIVSCMAFSPNTEGNLVIVYANHHFVEIDSVTGKYTEFTNKIVNIGKKNRQLPSEWTSKCFATKGVIFLEETDPKSQKTNILWMFHDESNICTFDQQSWLKNVFENTSIGEVSRESVVPKQAKRKKGTKATIFNEANLKPSMRVTKKYEHLVHLSAISSFSKSPEKCKDAPRTTPQVSLVAVEVKPQFLESQLPPSVRQKKFGAM